LKTLPHFGQVVAAHSMKHPVFGTSTPLKRQMLRVGRPLIVGLGLTAYFVHRAGTERTLQVVWDASGWLPLLLVLQGAIVALDALALRCLVGDAERRPPLRTWVRASALANACAVFLPVGRAAGEALRAASLAPTIGTARAASAGVRLQACSLFGTSTACGLAALVTMMSGPRSSLPRWLGLNAVVCAALGGAMVALLGSAHLTAWLRRQLERLVTVAPSSTSPPTQASAQAYALCVAGRLVQTFQYGIAMVAIGGRLDVRSAFTAQGMQLLGASIGDVVPGQLGAVEGTYSVFAELLALPDAAARVISLAMLMRTALVLLALAGVFVAALLPGAGAAPHDHLQAAGSAPKAGKSSL
jgi:hypothetical protein